MKFFSRLILPVVLVCLFPCAGLAFDELYDFTKVTCKEWLSKDQQESGLILVWFNGYNAGKTDRKKFITEPSDKKIQDFIQYCTKNDKETLIKAYDATMGK